MSSGSARAATNDPPKRAIAIALAIAAWLLGTIGLGQFYLGQRRRAVSWFVASSAGALLLGSLVRQERALGLAAVTAAWVLLVCVGVFGPIVDVIGLDAKRFVRIPRWQLFAFAVATAAVARFGSYLGRAFLVEAFKVPSGGMLPTIQLQDHIFVDKFGPRRPPRRGDVIVFEAPDPNPERERREVLMQRVVGLPGDTLEVDGVHPIINGWRVPSCALGAYDYREGADPEAKQAELFVEFLGDYAYLIQEDTTASVSHQGPYRVQSGEAWVLGDNRNNSRDSRAWAMGRGSGVPFQNIEGSALFVWLAFDAKGGVNWNRLGRDVLGPPRLAKDAPAGLLREIETCLSRRPTQTLPPSPAKL